MRQYGSHRQCLSQARRSRAEPRLGKPISGEEDQGPTERNGVRAVGLRKKARTSVNCIPLRQGKASFKPSAGNQLGLKGLWRQIQTGRQASRPQTTGTKRRHCFQLSDGKCNTKAIPKQLVHVLCQLRAGLRWLDRLQLHSSPGWPEKLCHG